MTNIQSILKSTEEFFCDSTLDKNHRYLSWEHCYKKFGEARGARKRKDVTPDLVDYLSLHLAFYLASWGMLRGSSFLLQKDYRVHIPAVKEILKEEYDILFGLTYEILKNEEELDQAVNALETLCKKLKRIYADIRKTVKKDVKNDITDTLLTKILLGTLGCVPAYDRFFIEGGKELKELGLITMPITNFNPKRSLYVLAEFYKTHYEQFRKLREETKNNGIEYPPMKLLDLAFWLVGFEKSLKK